MPSSRFTDGNSPADDGCEQLDNVKADILDNKLLEFKFHLATLPKAQHADLLDQLKLQQDLHRDSSENQIKRNLMKDYEAEQTDEDENKAEQTNNGVRRKIKLHMCVLQMTGCHPSWDTLKRLGICSGTNLPRVGLYLISTVT